MPAPRIPAEIRGPVAPNLVHYETVCRQFSFEDPSPWLGDLPPQGGNIAQLAVDRHAEGPLRDEEALRWLGRKGDVRRFTYADLAAWSSRFANVLADLGVQPGDRVFSLTGRIPELYFAALGTLKHRAVFCPLFSAFGPEPIRTRLEKGDAKVLVTTETLYRRKVAGLRERLPNLEHVLLIGRRGELTEVPDTVDLPRRLEAASDAYEVGPTDPEDPALLHFTSGTTGTPKGAVHVHRAVVWHYLSGLWALDLHERDIFWCTADPGWVTGTSYGILAPLLHGAVLVVDEAEMDVERWYAILQDQGVTVWYTAPTALRMLMKAGDDIPARHDLSHLRFVASVGEPLNPEVVLWTDRALGLAAHDNWWQTETGGILIANLASQEIRVGSMGRPLPGIEAAIVRRTEDGLAEPVDEPGVEGELAIRPGWPSMFRGYLHQPDRYAKCFSNGWYLTGDLAERDADGFFWFVGRADDVIKTAGHLIGPFEVESALMEHDAVAEAAVIGKPDPIAGAVIKAFVLLNPGFEPSEELRASILAHARRRLGAAVAPREIDFAADLPRTRSGKIMRRLLLARELGLPEGDTSTLEGSS